MKTVELFTLRLWPEVMGEDKIEWRGKIQHIRSGDVRYFRDWNTLVSFLLEAVPNLEASDLGSSRLSSGHSGGHKPSRFNPEAKAGKQRMPRSDARDLFALWRRGVERLWTRVGQRLLGWGDEFAGYLLATWIALLVPASPPLAFLEI